MPSNYKYYDAFGIERTVASVLDPLTLTGVGVTATSNVITVAEASVVFPGQPISCFGIPLGAFVHSIKRTTGSPTELTLWASSFNLTTGVWSTSAANANAIAGSTASNISAVVSGFCPFTIVSLAYAMGMWRNLHSFESKLFSYTAGVTNVAGASGGLGISIVPTTTTVASGLASMTAARVATTDALDAVPLKRHNGELHGAYILVSSLGHKSVVQALPGRELIYSPT
jgi:hypothetical protein